MSSTKWKMDGGVSGLQVFESAEAAIKNKSCTKYVTPSLTLHVLEKLGRLHESTRVKNDAILKKIEENAAEMVLKSLETMYGNSRNKTISKDHSLSVEVQALQILQYD